MNIYGKQFYIEQREGSLSSAREILPLVLELINPKSVIDIGCGIGTWLSVCKEYGIKEIKGVDGPWVNKNMLMIPEDTFIRADFTKPFEFGRVYDLAISTEVAEHIPQKYESVFFDSLTRMAPVILFSADIPHGGGHGHVNEQWQDYWRKLFDDRGYAAFDLIRPAIWNNENVQWWYRQNTFLYVRQDYLDTHLELKTMSERLRGFPLNIVHPVFFEEAVNPRTISLKKALSALPYGILRAFKKLLKF